MREKKKETDVASKEGKNSIKKSFFLLFFISFFPSQWSRRVTQLGYKSDDRTAYFPLSSAVTSLPLTLSPIKKEDEIFCSLLFAEKPTNRNRHTQTIGHISPEKWHKWLYPLCNWRWRTEEPRLQKKGHFNLTKIQSTVLLFIFQFYFTYQTILSVEYQHNLRFNNYNRRRIRINLFLP